MWGLPKHEIIIRIIAFVAALSTVIAGMIAGLVARSKQEVTLTDGVIIQPASMSDIRDVRSEIVCIKTDLASVQAQLGKVGELPKGTALALKIEELNSAVSVLLSQVSKLNGAILEDPEKAVSAILLRKELDVMKSEYNSSISIVRQQIEHVSSLGKWLVGALLTMAVGILGLAIGVIVQKRPGSG